MRKVSRYSMPGVVAKKVLGSPSLTLAVSCSPTTGWMSVRLRTFSFLQARTRKRLAKILVLTLRLVAAQKFLGAPKNWPKAWLCLRASSSGSVQPRLGHSLNLSLLVLLRGLGVGKMWGLFGLGG